VSKNVILSNQREIPLLHFLWKWKLVSVAALTKKFFPMCSEKTAYNRLLTLRHAGLITLRSDGKGENFICSLDAKGFAGIQEDLQPLAENGYMSEHLGHDFLVMESSPIK